MVESIKISEKAVVKLKEIDVGNGNHLRLYTVTGGCSGMTYEAALDTVVNESDCILFDDKGIKIIADKNSSLYLDGLEIDYSDDLVQSGFRFINKKAVTSCACGNSFECSQ